eukprot:41094-Prymnesium_polylepis.1
MAVSKPFGLHRFPASFSVIAVLWFVMNFPPAVASQQAWCSSGVRAGFVCCAATCGTCGGSGCGDGPGGWSACSLGPHGGSGPYTP